MEFETVKHKLGSWAEKFRPFIESQEFDKIFEHLISLKNRSKVICPISAQTFRAFAETPYENLKAIFVFSGPYAHRYKDNFVADGIALSCANSSKNTRALEKFYRGMEQDLSGGLNLDMLDAPDLGYLCRQGVLLLNAALTSELDKPGSHHELWRPFMDFFFTEIINAYQQTLPIVFFGRHAATYRRILMPFNAWIFETVDLMELEAEDKWEPAELFRKVNRIIAEAHPDTAPITWYQEVKRETNG